MKTAKDPRHLQRIKIMQELFAWDFNKEKKQSFSANKIENPIVSEIEKNLSQIDLWISETAPTWPVEKINKVDLAILRLAVFELMIKKDVPIKVVVDEAVELAKEYGAEASSSFINGALGKLISDKKL